MFSSRPHESWEKIHNKASVQKLLKETGLNNEVYERVFDKVIERFKKSDREGGIGLLKSKLSIDKHPELLDIVVSYVDQVFQEEIMNGVELASADSSPVEEERVPPIAPSVIPVSDDKMNSMEKSEGKGESISEETKNVPMKVVVQKPDIDPEKVFGKGNKIDTSKIEEAKIIEILPAHGQENDQSKIDHHALASKAFNENISRAFSILRWADDRYLRKTTNQFLDNPTSRIIDGLVEHLEEKIPDVDSLSGNDIDNLLSSDDSLSAENREMLGMLKLFKEREQTLTDVEKELMEKDPDLLETQFKKGDPVTFEGKEWTIAAIKGETFLLTNTDGEKIYVDSLELLHEIYQEKNQPESVFDGVQKLFVNLEAWEEEHPELRILRTEVFACAKEVDSAAKTKNAQAITDAEEAFEQSLETYEAKKKEIIAKTTKKDEPLVPENPEEKTYMGRAAKEFDKKFTDAKKRAQELENEARVENAFAEKETAMASAEILHNEREEVMTEFRRLKTAGLFTAEAKADIEQKLLAIKEKQEKALAVLEIVAQEEERIAKKDVKKKKEVVEKSEPVKKTADVLYVPLEGKEEQSWKGFEEAEIVKYVERVLEQNNYTPSEIEKDNLLGVVRDARNDAQRTLIANAESARKRAQSIEAKERRLERLTQITQNLEKALTNLETNVTRDLNDLIQKYTQKKS